MTYSIFLDLESYKEFLGVFSRALLITGSPSHRIKSQLTSLFEAFNFKAQVRHYPSIIIITLGNEVHTYNECCVITSPTGLHLSGIHELHNIYREVIRGRTHASEGTRKIQKILDTPPLYGIVTRWFLSFLMSFLICGFAFGGSLNDMWVAGLMGLLVRLLQSAAEGSQLSASGAQVFTSALVSFIAQLLSSFTSRIWCFTSISSSGVISLLPGFVIRE